MQDLRLNSKHVMGEDPRPPLKMALRPHHSAEAASGPGTVSISSVQVVLLVAILKVVTDKFISLSFLCPSPLF